MGCDFRIAMAHVFNASGVYQVGKAAFLSEFPDAIRDRARNGETGLMIPDALVRSADQ